MVSPQGSPFSDGPERPRSEQDEAINELGNIEMLTGDAVASTEAGALPEEGELGSGMTGVDENPGYLDEAPNGLADGGAAAADGARSAGASSRHCPETGTCCTPMPVTRAR